MLTERQKEALRHDISLCVTAGAGTGKTHVLVNRYISLIENAGCRPKEILALTFTDKAAAEMKERAEAEIFKRKGPFWEQIKEEMMWANISTFHSFCSKVLREYPIEAGIDPGFAILAENESEEIISDAIASLFNTMPGKEIEKSLSECLCAYGTYHLEVMLRGLYKKRRHSNDFFRRLEEDSDGLVEDWKSALLEEKKAAAADFKDNESAKGAADSLLMLAESFSGDGDKAAVYLKSVKEYLILLKSDSPDDICMGLYGVATTRGGSKNMGTKKVLGDCKELLVSSYSLLKDYADSLPSDILALEIEKESPDVKRTIKILRCLGDVYAEMAAEIRREKSIRGAIDFTDMINLTYELFRDNPEIAKNSFGRRYRYIMIDEFQDTDPVQAEITGWLLENENSSGENHCDRLFVVGDPKQSIYLFRDADVTQFKKSGETIRDEYGGETVALDISFRSTKEVLGFVNLFFSGLLKETGKPWDFGYEPVSVSDARTNDSGSVELIVCPRAETAGERAVLEAEAVAKRIFMIKGDKNFYVYPKTGGKSDSKKRSASFADIAVLIERRNNLKYIEHALKKYEIPYRVHGGLGLYEKQEILDAISLLSFLKDPLDDTALYAALRSPWFGFSDAEIFRICGGYATGLFEKLKRSPDPKAEQASVMLSEWLFFARRVSPSVIYRRILNESGIFAVFAGISGGRQMAANLGKLSDIIREREKGGFYNLDRLVCDLKTSVSSGEQKGEAEPDDTGEDAVAIMTVHASKGLEFPVVIMPGLSDPQPSDPSTMLIDGELGCGIRIPNFETGDDYENSPVLSLQKYRQKQKMQAEAKRLFYVAATRARDHLIMCGSEPKEMPKTLQACKTRMDLFMHILFPACTGSISDGIYEPEKDGNSCTVRIIRSENMPECSKSKSKAELVFLPGESFDTPVAAVPEKTFKAATETRSFSATEIASYIRNPEGYKNRADNKKPFNPFRRCRPGKAESGIILHELLAGADFETIRLKYPQEILKSQQEYDEELGRFYDSGFMEDAKQSLCELGFRTAIGGYLFRGSIDRLVEKSDGWYVIDYKTGRTDDDDRYSVQMAVYKKAAEAILKIPVKTVIYYTRTGEFSEVFIDMKKAEKQIISTCGQISEDLQ